MEGELELMRRNEDRGSGEEKEELHVHAENVRGVRLGGEI